MRALRFSNVPPRFGPTALHPEHTRVEVSLPVECESSSGVFCECCAAIGRESSSRHELEELELVLELELELVLELELEVELVLELVVVLELLLVKIACGGTFLRTAPLYLIKSFSLRSLSTRAWLLVSRILLDSAQRKRKCLKSELQNSPNFGSGYVSKSHLRKALLRRGVG